jgi:superfamily II DNA or RNA helicase
MTAVEVMRQFLQKHTEGLLAAYQALPALLREHSGIEQTVLAGGYGYRQILELVQNGADAILEASQRNPVARGGDRVHVLLRGSRLYVANTGAPLTTEGVEALLSSHSSPKRGNQIGRFGLGFKSLLALNGTIDVFSRTAGGIRFDPERCRKELSGRFGVDHAPRLRLAWSIDTAEAGLDDELARLSWAETIIRVDVGAAGTLDHLRHEMLSFPAEFLLFFPVQAQLLLDDGSSEARVLDVVPDGPDLVLHDGPGTSRWRVARKEVHVQDERARQDATHIHQRESVPLVWAMPLDARREEVGRFWAFFPTKTPTYLRGILNAPWKLNSDRNAIIGGEWNTALMKEAAALVAGTLPSLQVADDPARPLDAFPRQLERRDEDAAPLVEALWLAIENAAVIPDAAGVLRVASTLWRPPRDSGDLAVRWTGMSGPEASARFVHPSCLDRIRISRLATLADRLKVTLTGSNEPCLRKCSAETWFAAVAAVDTGKAAEVLRLAEAFAADCRPADWDAVRGALEIVPGSDGRLLNAAGVVIGPQVADLPGITTVAAALQADAESLRILTTVLKVRPLDEGVWGALLAERLRAVPRLAWLDGYSRAWEAFWSLFRQAPVTGRDRFLATHRDAVRVKRRDGTWAPIDSALMPGALVAADDATDNRGTLIDPTFHEADSALLVSIGARAVPEGDQGPAPFREIAGDRSMLIDWRNRCRDAYKSKFASSASRDYLQPSKFALPRGIDLLAELSGTANARLSRRYLNRLARGEFRAPLDFGHSTVARYETLQVSHPVHWILLSHGEVAIGSRCVSLSAIVARRHAAGLSCIARWPDDIGPIADLLSETLPAVTPSREEVTAMWVALMCTVTTPTEADDATAKGLWTSAASDGAIPETLPGRSGMVHLRDVFVTSSRDLARRAHRGPRPVYLLDETTREAWVNAGARDLVGSVQPTWSDAVGAPAMLTMVIPELSAVLRNGGQDVGRGQAVKDLTLRLEEEVDPVPCLLWEGTLLADLEQLGRLPRAERLRLMLGEAAAAGWLICSAQDALGKLGDKQVDELREAVARRDSLAARLLKAVGERREPLLEVLGELGDLDVVGAASSPRLAELVLSQLGPVTLVALTASLEEEGLKPPTKWNTAEARAFVAAIGFPETFAISPETRREAEEFVTGPMELPPLHDFQKEVLAGIAQLISIGEGRRRAVVSLPTGGGKTRVSVEAAVRLVLSPAGRRRCVIWVAQTDELCEQAVQAFRQVWINLGARGTDLRIVRLWGGNPNPAPPDDGRPVAVVASIQTLNYRLGAGDLAWLQQPGLVVVDECHHAVTPSYTNLLRWLDAEAPRPGAPAKDEPPIIGLSATPFRTADEESRRLARRFDGRWFPADQEALHARLQEQGVLARAQYEALRSESRLLEHELEGLSRLPEKWEGLDFEKALESINQRLGADAGRNQQLVEYLRISGGRSILFFANSVSHAQEMAARLMLEGIPAAAVSGSTPPSARRHFLERFQAGDIRVLCNHSVLTTGFDAPRTDMVLIARQVFSPVRYMQMVGRGLRGERNGGTANCRIVTVLDNLGRFDSRHPYHYCRQHFSSEAGRGTEPSNPGASGSLA